MLNFLGFFYLENIVPTMCQAGAEITKTSGIFSFLRLESLI